MIFVLLPADELLTTLEEGDCFGERALVDGEPYSASVRASSLKLRTMSITREAFEKEFGPLQALIKAAGSYL